MKECGIKGLIWKLIWTSHVIAFVEGYLERVREDEELSDEDFLIILGLATESAKKDVEELQKEIEAE